MVFEDYSPMRVLISFHSKTGRTESVTKQISEVLTKSNHEIVMHRVLPRRVMKAHRYNKDGKDIELVEPVVDLNDFDVVFIGTPVWNFCPSPIILSYLRQLTNVKGKSFVIFSTCTGLPGTTLKRMANILAVKGGKVIGSLTIKSIFDLDEEKLQIVKQFVEKLFASVDVL
ncbi:hypothetical protein CL629_02880 [bacterium]|nr:hypothetical protein [bacterium]|tara:strand:+ start:2853 stop:3365 length:513 start_codon:yes stop_codon:yes gene_type:complete